MKRIIKFVLLFCFISTIVFAQDAKEVVTKMDKFASKTGTIVKFIDHKLPDIRLIYGFIAEVAVREVVISGESKLFLRISKEEKYDTKIASIAYEDLIEVLKALEMIKLELSKDLELKSNYLENTFITEDGFKIGYYISKGKVKWFMKLERYGSGSTIFMKDFPSAEVILNSAKTKIEELQ